MNKIFDPICITEFMSWVLTIVVILNSSVISSIKLSISIAVFGSSPELGSSQKKIFWI